VTTKSSHSRIWFVNTLVLSPLLEFLEESVIMPEINKLIGGGIACCDVPGYGSLQNTQTKLTGGVLGVFSDIELDIRSIIR